MANPQLFKPAAELLGQILAGHSPADAVMERYFRAHPKLGMRERGVVAETVYACLRRQRSLSFCITGNTDSTATAEALVAACFVSFQGISGRALSAAGYHGNATTLVEQIHRCVPDSAPPAVQLDLPDWLYSALLDHYGATETAALGRALLEPASLDLRVNTIKATREEVAACLTSEGFPVEVTPYSPVGLRRPERAPLFKTRCFRNGLFEVQDEGSQLLSLLVEPRRHEMVVDFCAGAGGKTLHLAALMANSGSVYAMDVSAKRLDRLKPRLARAGADNVRRVVIQDERDLRVQRLAGKIDRVLVDAPCSGTGTLRRSPDIKWKSPDLDALTASQRSILASAATLVKPGGRLVYATCSLLRQENEEVVRDFLAEHTEFMPVSATAILERRGIHLPRTMEEQAPGNGHLPLGDWPLHLLPHRHHTDGFFAAVLERRKPD